MGATTLVDVPLDAWAVVFQHVPDRELVSTFNALQDAGVFTSMGRLDVFWSVVSKMKAEQTPTFATFPEARFFQDSADALCDMGVPRDVAQRVVGVANGDLAHAMSLLGWDV